MHKSFSCIKKFLTLDIFVGTNKEILAAVNRYDFFFYIVVRILTRYADLPKLKSLYNNYI